METIYGSPIYFPGSTAADMCIFLFSQIGRSFLVHTEQFYVTYFLALP